MGSCARQVSELLCPYKLALPLVRPSFLPHTTTSHFLSKLIPSPSNIFTAFVSPACTNKSQPQAASCKQPSLDRCKWHSQPQQSLVSLSSIITFPLSSFSLPSADLAPPPLPILYQSNCSLPAALPPLSPRRHLPPSPCLLFPFVTHMAIAFPAL